MSKMNHKRVCLIHEVIKEKKVMSNIELTLLLNTSNYHSLHSQKTNNCLVSLENILHS